jgi:hypothetical protein
MKNTICQVGKETNNGSTLLSMAELCKHKILLAKQFQIKEQYMKNTICEVGKETSNGLGKW